MNDHILEAWFIKKDIINLRILCEYSKWWSNNNLRGSRCSFWTFKFWKNWGNRSFFAYKHCLHFGYFSLLMIRSKTSIRCVLSRPFWQVLIISKDLMDDFLLLSLHIFNFLLIIFPIFYFLSQNQWLLYLQIIDSSTYSHFIYLNKPIYSLLELKKAIIIK
jgi:hypothetical protein